MALSRYVPFYNFSLSGETWDIYMCAKVPYWNTYQEFYVLRSSGLYKKTKRLHV